MFKFIGLLVNEFMRLHIDILMAMLSLYSMCTKIHVKLLKMNM